MKGNNYIDISIYLMTSLIDEELAKLKKIKLHIYFLDSKYT
jgi:hypothetical protein